LLLFNTMASAAFLAEQREVAPEQQRDRKDRALPQRAADIVADAGPLGVSSNEEADEGEQDETPSNETIEHLLGEADIGADLGLRHEEDENGQEEAKGLCKRVKEVLEVRVVTAGGIRRLQRNGQNDGSRQEEGSRLVSSKRPNTLEVIHLSFVQVVMP
jgi:hypothetical protein